MSSIRIRPRIRLFTDEQKQAVLDRYKGMLETREYPIQGRVVEHHIFVKFNKSQRHFWSPELTLEVIKNPMKEDEYSTHKEPSLIKGYVSPSPSVWAMFLFAYVSLGLLFLGLLIYGTSQLMLNQPTEMLWYALGCLVLTIAVFVATQIGQRLGENQTTMLLEFVNNGVSVKKKSVSQ